MFGINIWVYISLIMLGIVPIIVAIALGKGKAFVWFPAGVILYAISERVLRTILTSAVYMVRPYDAPIWNVKWKYGLMMGITQSIFVWMILALVLEMLSRKELWKHNLKYEICIGLGYTWIANYYLWDDYMMHVIVDHFKHPEFEYYGLGSNVIIEHLLQLMIASVFYTGLIFLIQYGIMTKNVVQCIVAAIVIHSVTELYLYLIPFDFQMSRVYLDIFYAIVSAIVVFCSVKLLKKAEAQMDEEV